MSASAHLPAIDEKFSGFARLYPLPNLVMFPHVMQPLHVSEPRYAALVEDALHDDQLIAMSMLQPGWEKNYEGRPPVEPVVCLGYISSHSLDCPGSYNILLSGLRRATIEYELPPASLYRQAKVTLLDDAYSSHGAAERATLREQLGDRFRERLPSTLAVRRQFEQLLTKSVPLGLLVDVIAFTIDLPLEAKQSLLAEFRVEDRARRLLDLLSRSHRAPCDWTSVFPPPFSDN